MPQRVKCAYGCTQFCAYYAMLSRYLRDAIQSAMLSLAAGCLWFLVLVGSKLTCFPCLWARCVAVSYCVAFRCAVSGHCRASKRSSEGRQAWCELRRLTVFVARLRSAGCRNRPRRIAASHSDSGDGPAACTGVITPQAHEYRRVQPQHVAWNSRRQEKQGTLASVAFALRTEVVGLFGGWAARSLSSSSSSSYAAGSCRSL